MKNRKHLLNFPESKDAYWFLFWIGRIYHIKGWHVEMYFYNQNFASDKITSNFERKKIFKQILPVSYLVEYGLGTIYNYRDKVILQTRSNSLYTVKLEKKFNVTKKTFPLVNNELFSDLPLESENSEFSYLKVIGQNTNGSRATVLLSPYTILKFLLPNHDRLIPYAIAGTLLDGFKLNSLTTSEDTETNLTIGKINYDVNIMTESEALSLAPFIFMKDSVGLKILNSLYSHLNKAWINGKKGNIESYIGVNWPFSTSVFDVTGKIYDIHDNGRKQKYLLGYSITNFKFIEKNIFTVDEVILYPYNSKNSTPDRENHTPQDVMRIGKPNTVGLSLVLNRDLASDTSADDIIVKGFGNPFHLPTQIIKRKEQYGAYNVKTIPINKEISGVVREIQNLQSDAHLTIENIKTSTISIGNFQYFKVVLEILQEKIESQSGTFNEFIVNTIGLNCQFAELNINGYFNYIVEFGNGIIGVFHSVNNSQISNESLIQLARLFQKHEAAIEKTGKILWTFIKEKSSKFFLSKGIVILTGVKHNRSKEKNSVREDEKSLIYKSATKTADKIYDERIIFKIL